MIDELIIALENLQEAKAEYREASKKFERIFKSAVSAIVVDVINNNPHR